MINIIIELLLLILGFMLLSLSMSRHYSQVTNRRQRLPKAWLWVFRLIAYCLLIAAIILAINVWGIALGLVYCFSSAMLVALLVSLILAYQPHWLRIIPVMMKLL